MREEDVNIAFRGAREYREMLQRTALDRGLKVKGLIELAVRNLMAEAVPNPELVHVCPICESKTSDVREHVPEYQEPDSVPETEQRLQSVKKGAYFIPDPIADAAMQPAVRPWIKMLLDVFNSGDEDALKATQSGLRSLCRLLGEDPDAIISSESRSPKDRPGSARVNRDARGDSKNDRHPQKKVG